ncbi:unnamed protein product [Coffea canephora]|uniref:DH200=94 genomic scaffold, scaffold_3162 n=1 Tax=Coffea canephora TaxID=49390 RepID=A0A068VKQ8_COFCA|nr:unnamed protein product [Coffea canephora]
MADALISSTIQVTLERALSLASDRIGLLVGFKKDVASLSRTLSFINALLADAEERQQNQDRGVQEWLKSLEEVAYDAQNVLDELHYESLRHQVESRNRHKLKVRDIKDKLNEINQRAHGLLLVSRAVVTAALPAAPPAGDTRNRQTDSVVAPMVGRADDESKIVKMLLSPSEKVVSVLPINGMGGLGKTTLAKSIYNNHQIDGHFQKKIWVCVSEKVPRVELFKLILGQLNDKKDEVGDRQNIVQEVGKELGKLRYLLVLDDVWDDSQTLWDDFFNTLTGLNPINPPKGSWCLITTRLHLVAHKGYPLGRLPGDHCWSILKGKVVDGEEVPNELDAIKDRAIQICNGLPLGSLSDDMLTKLKNLHVLKLSGVQNQNLPISIGKLTHLRYINFEGCTIETLPESVCKLYNLQTLRLKRFVLKVLPKGTCDLISLRHLHFYTTKEFQMPLNMGRLTCLQTLEFFNVGREKGRRIGELGSLKNLKGKLIIHNLELVKDKEGAEEAKLSEKTNLFRLQLEWAHDLEGDDYNDKDVLDGLRPHPNLEELLIFFFYGRSISSMVNGFANNNNTPRLRVTNCNNLISFPLDLQQTPSLLLLVLTCCPKLKTSMTPKGFVFLTSLRELAIGPFSDDGDDHENSSIYNEFDWSGLISSSSSSSSSALRKLGLIGLPHMEALPHQIQYLTTLTSLTLRDFGGIKALPDWFGNFAALEKLWLIGFKELRHLPSEDAMRSLTKLKLLGVYRSPLLKERCTPESSGPDFQWSKVSHIQDLIIIG